MRIERLEVLRYGALTEKSFVFRPDAKLHLVYGPNEAGKSSVLAALSDLLFGFGPRKAYDFLHDAATLRVAATVRRSDGASLSFRRRRGNKNTLLAHADLETPLHDDALAPFLGTLNRETFERAFGLDSHRLRTGAAEMLEAGGDAAGTLFAAASGLTGLTRLRADLESEAGTLYAPRASKDRRFYQILEQHDAARQIERANELKANDWKALLAEIEQHETQLGILREQQVGLRRSVSRLQRLRQLQPILAEVDGELAQLREFADLGDIVPELAGDLEAALIADEAARRVVAETEASRQNASDAMGRVVIDEPMLRSASEITALFARSGDYTSKRHDLPRIQAEQDERTAQIGQLSQRLGLASADELPERQPTDAALGELRALLKEGAGARVRVADLGNRLAEERETLAELENLQSQATLIDTRLWRERFAALGPERAQVERLQEMRTRFAGQQRKLAEQAGRLVPPVGDLARLASVPLPTVDAVRRQSRELQTAMGTLEALRERLRAAISDLRDLEAAIAADEAGVPIPSRAAIAEARAARDAAFAALKDGLNGKVPPPAAAITAFESLSEVADRLADTALAEADRVSRHASNLLRRSELEKLTAEFETGLTSAEGTHADVFAAYQRLFTPVGIAPLSPDEMIVWLQTMSTLLEDRQTTLALADEIAEIEALAEGLRPALIEIATGIGSAPSDALPVGALARAIADRLVQLADIWTESRTVAGKREDAQRRVRRLESDLAEAGAAEADWSARFATAVVSVGLTATATFEGANAAIAVWEQLPALQHERDNRASRVNGMRRDIEAFEREVDDLSAHVAPDLAGRAASDVIAELRKRAEAVQAAAAQRAGIEAQIEALDVRLVIARREGQDAAERLALLARGLPTDIDLRALVGRLRRRESLQASLEKCRHRFREAAEGIDEAHIREELAGFDRDAAAAEIAGFEETESHLVEEINQHFALLSDARRRREVLEAGGGVELAVFQKHAAEAEIVDVARQWVILKLASALLGSAMERHREANADPLVDRAGRLLSTLTGGSLVRLVEDYDEDDQPRLKGVRPSGERLGVEAMSEGTRDQLYLALRLAYLEDYARNNEPAPFIGDDIFQTFDDDRTIAGLRALAETSSSFQPILFTHHRSVVDAGIKALGGDLDLIEW